MDRGQFSITLFYGKEITIFQCGLLDLDEDQMCPPGQNELDSPALECPYGQSPTVCLLCN